MLKVHVNRIWFTFMACIVEFLNNSYHILMQTQQFCLYFMVMTQSHLYVVQVVPKILLVISPIWHQFHPVFYS